MSTRTTVASANVLRSLPPAAARHALETVLERSPDLVGLQEWELPRAPLLATTGEVRLGLRGRIRWAGSPGRGTAPAAAYHWFAPVLGGCAVGARADRYALVRVRSVLLHRPGRADNPNRWRGLEPPRVATVATYADRETGRPVHLVDYHLAPGVQDGTRLRTDRPLLLARHHQQVQRLQRLVHRLVDSGGDVYAVGDANVDGFRLAGLVSAWEGHEEVPGTLGRRTVDDVHGPRAAVHVQLVQTGSDHQAVLATRTNGDGG